MQDLCKLLRGNPYPGRGIVVGRGCAYYWIMGRSANSRNRVFTLTEDGIRTEAHDPGKMEDPSLIIYHPVRRMGGDLVVTNGDQTDTIVQAGGLWAGCRTRTYEPDAPNFTPRISAVIHEDGGFELAILKRDPASASGRCLRELFFYEAADEGVGYFVSTYQTDGDPLPSFAGEPVAVTLPSPDELWDALDEDNKVSLYANVRGTVTLYNKNLGD
ncbi:IMP cyclohydrolase [Olsenella massiliensis]|uniref:IMP cyclohydrolase n=1 Tax=Olsenella massiliensis TaxID=1622075 RepID=UPI00071CCC69|nr:IMP cyclohydrolase [Olsenella massiliensis]